MSAEYDKFISGLFARADSASFPLSGAFELTSRCPLDCKMCYIHRKENDCEALRREKSAQWWLNLAKQASEAGMLLLLLTGGEPLLRKDFDEIYLGAKQLGLIVSVNTNALLIDDERVRFFVANPPQRLNISLYGASEETYRNLCGNGAAYEKVRSAIVKLVEAGISVRLNLTVTEYNRNDVGRIYDFAKQYNLPVQTVTYMFPPLRAGGSASRLSAAQAAQAKLDCLRCKYGEDMLGRFLSAANSMLPESEAGECGDTCGERIPCRAGLSTFWVTWDGFVSPCGMMNKPFFKADDFSSAWAQLQKARQDIVLPPECRGCELRAYCDVCAAVTLAETGSFSGVPDYVCEKAAAYKALCDQYIN